MTDKCNMKGCTLHAQNGKTIPMYRKSKGEQFPEDVQHRPVCIYHYLFEKLLKDYSSILVVIVITSLLLTNAIQVSTNATTVFGVIQTAGVLFAICIGTLCIVMASLLLLIEIPRRIHQTITAKR